jgi:hypothetical protein
VNRLRPERHCGAYAGSNIRSGSTVTISYALSRPSFEGHSAHIRASRVAGDTWIDLHLSVTKNVPEDDCRKAVRELLHSVSIRLR